MSLFGDAVDVAMIEFQRMMEDIETEERMEDIKTEEGMGMEMEMDMDMGMVEMGMETIELSIFCLVSNFKSMLICR